MGKSKTAKATTVPAASKKERAKARNAERAAAQESRHQVNLSVGTSKWQLAKKKRSERRAAV